MRLAIILALLLVACDQSDGRTTLGERVSAVVFEAWYEAGMPEVSDRGDCARVADLQIYSPATVERYERVCPAKSWACLNWVALPGRLRGLYRPAAVLHPELPASLWATQAVHEHLHAVSSCTGLGVDYYHLNPRVWESGGPDSVEAKAYRKLYRK